MKITMQIAKYKEVVVMEEKTPYNRTVSSPAEVARIFMEIWGDPLQELFVVFMLDTKNRIAGVEMVSMGTLSQTIVHPRDVFRSAITKNSNSILVAHNHPSGDSTPSPEDCAMVDRLKEAGKILGIPLLDSVIIGTTTYSFKEEGRI